MGIIKKLEDFMGHDWWVFEFGFFSAVAMFEACWIPIAWTLLNSLRDSGVI